MAATTNYRSATTITTDGATPYINLSECTVTDNITCDHPLAKSNANVYFRNFGDFAIPPGSIVTAVHIRIISKSSHGLFVAVSPGTTYSANCQTPSDLWTTFSGSAMTIRTFTSPLTNGLLSSCLSLNKIQSNSFIWRVNFSSAQNWSANIDNFEIAFDYTPAATPTPTPTLTPTPTPSGPAPFLDLPWDYEAKGLSFNEAANAINSYFDHEYPLLSSGMIEPSGKGNSVIYFRGGLQNFDRDYSAHDGYDYGIPAKITIGEPVLAAGSGLATFVSKYDSRGGGNVIKIDHQNGYQTWYEHLDDEELIVNISGKAVGVSAGQKIGKVGMTGNTSGAHIHFGVFEDKNKDGNFDDNVPDGVTDPFGWQSKEPDPWETYTFFDWAGKKRTGNKSYYLWKKQIDKLDATLPANGGVFKTSRFSADFPQGATSTPLIIQMIASPVVRVSAFLSSVGSTITITAQDALGNIIKTFEKPFLLKGDYSSVDTSRYNTDTISFYSSNDGKTWTKEVTTVDPITKTASAQLNHLTQFALVAERLDTTPPVTTASLSGLEGQTKWFRSDVQLTLEAIDNEAGLGVDYTLYRLPGKDWEQYKEPLLFSSEGEYTIEFYSVDKDENRETIKSVEFNIDKTAPEVSLDASPKEIWPPNGKMVDIQVNGSASDTHLHLTSTIVVDEYRRVEPILTSLEQTIQLEASREGEDTDGRTYTIKRVAEDLAGNRTEKEVQVLVPHDQGKNNENKEK